MFVFDEQYQLTINLRKENIVNAMGVDILLQKDMLSKFFKKCFVQNIFIKDQRLKSKNQSQDKTN